MIQVLRELGPWKLNYWDIDSLVIIACTTQDDDVIWNPQATYEMFPRLAVHLAIMDLPFNQILYIHRRLMISLHPDDKKTLEEKNNIRIITDIRNLVIYWKTEKKNGAAGEKKEKKKEDEDGEKVKKDERRKKEKNKLKYEDDKRTLTVNRKKKNQERKDGHMGRGKAFTPEQERAILQYVYSKVKNDYDFGTKSTMLTRPEDWIDLEKKPGMERTATSLENKRKANMGRGLGYSPEEDQKMIAYAYQKIKHSFDFGYKCSKLASAKDWEELATEMEDKNAESLEQRFRSRLKGKLYGFDNVDAEKILMIGKQLGVGMSDEVQKAFEEKNGMSIQLSGEKKIVDWSKSTN